MDIWEVRLFKVLFLLDYYTSVIPHYALGSLLQAHTFKLYFILAERFISLKKKKKSHPLGICIFNILLSIGTRQNGLIWHEL